jgi:hypothetical protein
MTFYGNNRGKLLAPGGTNGLSVKQTWQTQLFCVGLYANG